MRDRGNDTSIDVKSPIAADTVNLEMISDSNRLNRHKAASIRSISHQSDIIDSDDEDSCDIIQNQLEFGVPQKRRTNQSNYSVKSERLTEIDNNLE